MKSSTNYPIVEKIVKFIRTINVEPIVFLLCFGGGILEIPARDLVLTRTCLSGSYFFGDVTYPPDICGNLTNYAEEQKEVQETVSKFNSATTILRVTLLMFVTIFLGSWCDSGGRKGLLVLTCVGRLFLVGSLLFNFIHEDHVIEFFWLEFPNFLCGYDNSLFIGAFAMVADETSPKMRTIRILIISALWHIGMALSNLVTGYILEFGTFYASLATNCVVVVAALLYTLCVLRSSQVLAKKASLGNIFSFKGFLDSVSTVFKKRSNGLRHIIILLIFTACLCEFSWGLRFMGIDYYYTRRKFNWPEAAENPTFPVTWLSQYYTILDVPQTLAVFIIVPFLTNVFNVHDAIIGTLGHLSLMAILVNVAMTTNRNMMYLNAVLGIFVPTQSPSIRAMLSKIVDPGEIGKVFAFQSISMNIGALCWPVISMLYAATIDWYLGFVYLFLAAVLVIVVLNTLYVFRYLTTLERKDGVITTSYYQNKV